MYKIFGQHDYVYRIFCWLLSFLGYFALYRLVTEILNDFKWGILISLLTFTSPILIYYGISFLTEPISLSFVFISWLFFYRYFTKRDPLSFLFGLLFMTLSALLKINGLISFFAILGGFTIHILGQKQKILVNKRLIAYTILSLSIIFGWLFFANNYNTQNHTSYFFMQIAPAWELSKQDFWETLHFISDWTREYFYPTGRHVLYLLCTMILVLFHKNQLNKSVFFTYLLCIIGFIGFIIIFFKQFKDHDYYMVPLLFIIPFTFTVFLLKFNHFISKTHRINHGVQILFTALLIVSSVYAKNRTDKRFINKSDWVIEELYDLAPILKLNGIAQEDLILAPLDPSTNITLYALKMKGWTRYNVEESQLKIDNVIEKGARWMVLPTIEVNKHKYLEKYLKHLKFKQHGVSFYDLAPNPQN